MKKIAKSLLVGLCAVTFLFGAAACGKSAYELAVKNGFTGTEKEWLATLQGIDGHDGKDLTAKDIYETAVTNGYEGTYLDFCRDVLQVELTEGNNVDTIARNVTSVVSIYCGFSKTERTNPWMVQTKYYPTAGAGVIIDLDKETGDALIVTNYHVIYDANGDTANGISGSIYLYTYGAYNAFSNRVNISSMSFSCSGVSVRDTSAFVRCLHNSSGKGFGLSKGLIAFIFLHSTI